MSTARVPDLVRKRDGRLVAFEADRISQSLFAATEATGQPSAFLARELTDGVLHFLDVELGPEPPTTTQIAELIAKVIRELGHPVLAQVYTQRIGQEEMPPDASSTKAARAEGIIPFSKDDSPEMVVRRCLASYSLQAIFSRDLAAAHQEGLLTLFGLESPDEFARYLMAPRDGLSGWLPLLGAPARAVVFDSPEYWLTEETANPWLAGLAEFCEATGRTALVNVHIDPPPLWVSKPVQGPLFASAAGESNAESARRAASALLEAKSRLGKDSVRVTSHENESSKKAVDLAPGVDRQHGAALMDVGLVLPRFLAMPAIDGDVQVFLSKLPSLARMAVRAGVQKRNYLRKRSQDCPALTRGFLLERATLVVLPLELDEVLRTLLGTDNGKLALDLRDQVLEILRRTLHAESKSTNLEIALIKPDAEPRLDAAPL